MTEFKQGWFLRVIPWKAQYTGSATPAWYRVAYMDHNTRREIACPIGLHWIVRFFRRCWEWSLRYRASWFERAILVAWNQGYWSGHSKIEALERRLDQLAKNYENSASYAQGVEKYLILESAQRIRLLLDRNSQFHEFLDLNSNGTPHD